MDCPKCVTIKRVDCTQIMTHFEVGSKLSPPNVIILNAGDPLSNDSAVDKCLRMYLTEIDEVLVIVKQIKKQK
ncbi:hypothetical protein RirG_125160 [Rhizophagus irregularis DAOM 197198w]|uniref:Uncharacterized protein n=1 Tax=Rhizophagus irregularis (strain DAOM 197198w) TaxID=1432141 RepID=A0A015MHG8_RHIIW|nr:hypothetical protein RirG_125160 [Rhizophagus irregularis DAOM 197198w]